MRKTLFFGFTVLFLLFCPVTTFSQEPTGLEKTRDLQKEIERMQQDEEKRQQEELEVLKGLDPQLYKERKSLIERQNNINKIISSYRGGKVSLVQAENQLYPLIKEGMQGYLDNLGGEIARLEKKLESLKKAKKNPDILIKKNISQLLGQIPPAPEDFM